MALTKTEKAPLRTRAASSIVVVTGPAKGLVGGQSRHLDLLQMLADRLGCDFVRVAIGRRAGERGGARLLLRMLGDYCHFIAVLRQAIGSGSRVVVHINSSVQYASLVRDVGFAVIARLLRPDAQLLQIHGCELRGPEDKQPLLRALARLVAVLAGDLVVLSHAQACAIGGPALAGKVIPNAVPLQEAVKRDHRSGEGLLPLQVLYLGRLTEQKGVLLCLDAAARLRDRGVSVHLSLAGDGPLLEGLPDRIAQLGLGDHVTVLGAVPPAAVRPLLAAHDLLWAPSLTTEGQPYSLIEALEAGLPVLTTAAGPAMREMIDSSGGALIAVTASPESLVAATEQLSFDPERLVCLQRLARQTAERCHSLDGTLAQWQSAWSVVRLGTRQSEAPAA